MKSNPATQEARRKAQELRQADAKRAMGDWQKAQQAVDEKTARLRALRLAKEAADAKQAEAAREAKAKAATVQSIKAARRAKADAGAV